MRLLSAVPLADDLRRHSTGSAVLAVGDTINSSRGKARAKPWVIVSVASSLDGCIDDNSSQRLTLSSRQDLAAVDALRASCDAIMVGAGTVRSDDPVLMVRSLRRRWLRLASGRSASPLKVTLTRSGDFGGARRFFSKGKTLIYSQKGLGSAHPSSAVVELEECTMDRVLADLHRRGITRLMIEGGTSIISQVVRDLADELRVAVAPLFVGDARAPRLLGPDGLALRLKLEKVHRCGDMAVMRYRFG